jgi:hypothetical protein
MKWKILFCLTWKDKKEFPELAKYNRLGEEIIESL